MSDRHCFPAEVGTQWRTGLELEMLAASGGVSHALAERRLEALCKMLSSDPLSVLDLVALPAGGADGLTIAVTVRDDLGVNLALAANDPELIRHEETSAHDDSAP